MAQIKTTTRLIQTKETVKEIFDKFSHQWIELTEISYGEKASGDRVSHESKIHINKDFIVEMYD
jgi:hypothetical protein